MIPARLGSQRLKKKNLQEIDGSSLLSLAIRKCIQAKAFDEIFVNSESLIFKKIALTEGAKFHHRPDHLGDSEATSEDYITEFFQNYHCEYLIQVHSIAPLLDAAGVKGFTKRFLESDFDVLLSVVQEKIECLHNGLPLNFSFQQKTNSQLLSPIERITWSITGWKRSRFLEAVSEGKCATYHGKVGTFPICREAGHIIKTEDDLRIAQALWTARNT